MKVKMIDRLFALFTAIITVVAIAVFIAIVFDFASVTQLREWVLGVTEDVLAAQITYSIMGVFGIVIALRVMVAMAMDTPQSESTAAPTSIHLSTSDYGSTYVSLAAIDAMAQRHCRNVQKVKECMTNVTSCENGVRIAIKLVLSNEANIPEITASLQKSLKEYVEELSGVAVADVSILIISAPSSQKL